MYALPLDVNALMWRLTEKKCTAHLPTFFHVLATCEKSPDASCMVKQDRLAALAGVSKATVSRSLTRLEQAGIIIRAGAALWVTPMNDQEVQSYCEAMWAAGWQAISAPCTDQMGVRWRQEWQADDVREVYTAAGSSADPRIVLTHRSAPAASRARAIETFLVHGAIGAADGLRSVADTGTGADNYKFIDYNKKIEKRRRVDQIGGDPHGINGSKLIQVQVQQDHGSPCMNMSQKRVFNAAPVPVSATDLVADEDRDDRIGSGTRGADRTGSDQIGDASASGCGSATRKKRVNSGEVQEVILSSCRSATSQGSLIGKRAVIPTRVREGGRERAGAREGGDAKTKQPGGVRSQAPLLTIEDSEPNRRPSQRRLRMEALMGQAPLNEYRIRHSDPKGKFDDLYEIEHLSAQIGLQYGLNLEMMRRTPFGNPRKIALMARVTQIGGKRATLEFLEWAMHKALEEPEWLEDICWNQADMYLIQSKAALRQYLTMKEAAERAALIASRAAAAQAAPLPENEGAPRAPRVARPAEQHTATMPQPVRKGSIESYRGGITAPVPIELLRLDDEEFIEFFKRPEFLRLPHDPHQGNMLFGWLVRPPAEQAMGFQQWVYYMVDMRRRYTGLIAFDHAQHRASRCGCDACYHYRAHADSIDRLLAQPVVWRQREAIVKTGLDDDFLEPEDYIASGLDPETRHYTLEDRRRMDEAAAAWKERGAVLWEEARLNRPPI